MSGATALPTEPQPLPSTQASFNGIIHMYKVCESCAGIRKPWSNVDIRSIPSVQMRKGGRRNFLNSLPKNDTSFDALI